jgi:4-amino-4-deoxy-L-arabinose transferase-like glycosyltransferase
LKRPVLVSAVVLLVTQCILLAGVFTQAPHTGGDNAGYVALAYSLAERGTYQELWDPAEPPHTKYPPVFAALLAGAILLGAKGWTSLKMVPLVSTLLAGLFCFFWVRERKGVGLALGVGLLFVLSDAVVDYSRWILSDPTFLALTLGGIWCLEKARIFLRFSFRAWRNSWSMWRARNRGGFFR